MSRILIVVVSAATLLTAAARATFAAPGDAFQPLDPATGVAAGTPFIPSDSPSGPITKCEDRVDKAAAKLVRAVLTCHQKRAAGVDEAAEERCETTAVHKFLATSTTGCGSCTDVVEMEGALDAYGEILEPTSIFCAGSVRFGSDDGNGMIPPDSPHGPIAKCEIRIAKAAASLAVAISACHQQRASGKLTASDESTCESAARTKFLATDTTGCDPCTALDFVDSITEAMLDVAGANRSYCEVPTTPCDRADRACTCTFGDPFAATPGDPAVCMAHGADAGFSCNPRGIQRYGCQSDADCGQDPGRLPLKCVVGGAVFGDPPGGVCVYDCSLPTLPTTTSSTSSTLTTTSSTTSTTLGTANYVFVTHRYFDGNLGGLAGADQKCAEEAFAAGLPGTYKAWISTSATSAASRLTHGIAPYVMVDGTRIADNWTDLTDGAIDVPITLNATCGYDGTGGAWTGTDPSGGIAPGSIFVTCLDWTYNQSNAPGADGWVGSSNGDWSLNSVQPTDTCNVMSRLYCIAQQATTATTCITTTTSTSTTSTTLPWLVFATSTLHNANLGGLAGADAICQARADAAGLTGTYKAWLSTHVTSAASRLNHETTPYRLVDGSVVANDWNDLTSQALRQAIDEDETGATIQGPRFTDAAWTATNGSGVFVTYPGFFPTSDCQQWTMGVPDDSDAPITGDIRASDETWTDVGPTDCSELLRLYCIQQTIQP